jgi:hypothetical protein
MSNPLPTSPLSGGGVLGSDIQVMAISVPSPAKGRARVGLKS